MVYRSTLSRVLFLVACLFATVEAVPGAPQEIIPAEFHGAIQPQVAVAPSGRVHLVFGQGTSIFHAVCEKGGTTFSKPVLVGELPKLALGMRRGPRVSATEKAVAVTAISHGDGNLHAWCSVDGGKQWTETRPINEKPNSAREGLHALDGDGRGYLFVVWLDLRNGGTELWGAASHDGGARWGANARIYQSPDGHICECCVPSVAVAPQGVVAVMWRNWLNGARDMYLALSKDRGATFAPAEKLGTGTWTLKGCPMDGGGVALNSDGRPVTVWRRETTVFANATGEGERPLADAAAQPVVIAGRGAPYYFWQSHGDLFLQKGNATPTRLAGNAAFAAAAARPSGGPVIVWEGTVGSKKTLFAERID